MTRTSLSSALALLLLAAACGGGDPGGSTEATGAASDGTTSVATADGSTNYQIVGRATDARTGTPIAGAKVTGKGLGTATTAADGSYGLAARSGSYTLTATAQGYLTATQQVRVPRHGSVTANWALSAVASCIYTYGDWTTCSASGTQTRTVLSATPSGCTGTPLTSRSCTPPPLVGPTPAAAAYKVFANNDLGMHCVDRSFAVFSILPPYNVVDAQVVGLQGTGKPILMGANQVRVSYTGVADATGSINTTSIGKSDFWQYVAQLYGAALAPGQGLQGLWMPADAPDTWSASLAWDAEMGLYKAPGIPIFPVDDAGNVNRYPLLRFTAYDGTGKALASTDVVLPVSEETSCQTCHATGQVAASVGGLAWSTDPDLEAQARRNVLTLHDARTGTHLQPPVLCAACHYSPALDLAGTGPSTQQAAHGTMSAVMHAFHGDKMAGLVDAPVPPGGSPPSPATQACYQCHPGASTQCLRGAMTTKVDCQNCHGGMASVGGTSPLRAGGSIDGTNDGLPRRPWLDLPRCQSCHAGDAVAKTTLASAPPLAADGLRFLDAFVPGDASASPILATNRRFAEEPGKLYRKSKGHGGLACEACHGSTHAIWSGNANDDVAATALQGHAGTIGECSACHLAPPTNGLGGPHGMHPVGSAWVSAHPSLAEGRQASCQPCHGTDYRGTVLSRMFATRTVAGRTLQAGAVVGCYTCHNGPNP